MAGVRGGGRGGGGSGGSLPSYLPLLTNWCRNIPASQGHSPLVEGQLGVPLERREIMASLEKTAGITR